MAFTIRPDAEMARALTALSIEEGVSRQEIIRRAVLDRYARSAHFERVVIATTEMQDRWAHVIERLSHT